MVWEGRKFKYLLVDLDGTLLDAWNVPAHLEFVARTYFALRKHARPSQILTMLYRFGRELEKPPVDLTNYQRGVQIVMENLGVSEENAKKILKHEVPQIFPKLSRYFYPRRGAKDFVEWARSKYTLILATNPVWAEEIIRLRLDWAKIEPTVFRSITHAVRMHACKPLKEYYEEIIQQEELNPAECLLIGNDLRQDLPAVQVGISVFIVGRRGGLKALRHERAQAPAYQGGFTDLQGTLNF